MSCNSAGKCPEASRSEWCATRVKPKNKAFLWKADCGELAGPLCRRIHAVQFAETPAPCGPPTAGLQRARPGAVSGACWQVCVRLGAKGQLSSCHV